MKEKGFTLIELLAVIVILAIIALIATPIILNIISDSKEESNKRSVELYGKAVEQAIAKAQLNGIEIPAGDLSDNLLSSVQYSGNVVTCTTNKLYEDGNIYLEDCTVNGVKTTKTYGTQQEILVKLNDICTPVTQTTASKDTEENLVGKIPTGNYELGEEYSCEVKEGTSYNFFVLSKEGNKVNLIMDSNVRTNGEAVKEAIPTIEQRGLVAWLSDADFKAAGGVLKDDMKNDGGQCQHGGRCSNNEYGPITATKYLKEATSSWNKVSSIIEMYNDEGNHFTNFKITGHARMPKKAEVEGTGCTTSRGSCPLWMVNYLPAVVSGYWTLSASASGSGYAWVVNPIKPNGLLSAYLYNDFVSNSGSRGVRPVITLEI